MNFNDIRASVIRNFFIIFAIIILVTAALNPDFVFSSGEIGIVALFALLSDFTSLVYWSNTELTDKQQITRRIIHFVLIEGIILSMGNLWGICSGILQNVIFGVEILGIYVIVCIIDWMIDCKTAKDINEKLKGIHMESDD